MSSASATAAREEVLASGSALLRHGGVLVVPLTVGALALARGGYFATSWGWAALAFLWAASMALLLRGRIALSRPERALLAATAALVAWIGLSTVWSSARVESVDELERALVYLAGLSALLLLTRMRSAPQLLAGLLAAVTLVAAYALATRLLPDRVGSFDSIAGYRLSDPIGYWNGLGIWAVMGALLAVGFTVRAERLAGRAAAAASFPVLLLTMYFTFSRGSWLALVAGLAVATALDARRLRLLATLLVLAPGCAAVVWVALRSSALTTVDSPFSSAAGEGHRLALVLVVAVVGSALLAILLDVAGRRFPPARGARMAFAVVLVAAALTATGAVLAVYGGPAKLARGAYHSFTSPPVRGPQLRERLFSLSSNGRIDLWSVAWADAREHTLAGGGAGSFEQYWRVHRPARQEVRDAHSLYLETLAELGVVGIVLLVLVLGIPLRALRHRSVPLVPFALGAYAAFLLHAAVDWDWELPAVTLTGLCCGAAALIASRGRETRVTSVSRRARYAGFALVVVLAAFSVTTLIGNRAAASAASAASAENWSRAESEARRAERWLPWSSEPYRLLGDASFGRGDFPEAASWYRKALVRDPRDWELWFDLGYSTSGAESRAAFARAAALDPLNPDIPERQPEASHAAP